MLNLKIIVGSTREGRFSEKVLPWLHNTLLGEEGFITEVLDLRESNLPFLQSATPPSMVKDGQYDDPIITAWGKKIAEADAFLIITPEYNYGYPAVLKNALDVVYKEWNRKPVAFISYGSMGGARAINQLRAVTSYLQMAPVESVNLPGPWTLMDEDGLLKECAFDAFTPNLKTTLKSLRWWGDALKAKRTA